MKKDTGYFNNIIAKSFEMMKGVEKRLGELNDQPLGQRRLTRDQQLTRYRQLTKDDFRQLYEDKGPEEVARYIQAMEHIKRE